MLWLRVIPILLLIAANTVLHVTPLMAVAVFKALLPFEKIRLACNPLLTGLAASWIAVNSAMIDRFTRTRFHVEEAAAPRMDGHYLVLANHQSWVDILVLQKLFNRRIPLLRFFLKRQLFWVPLLGLAWWALDFPFMRRHSEEFLKKHPEMRGKDQETTRKACEKFAQMPTSVMNFLEGTRFTPAKQKRQQSPYKHLLKPKAGGFATALNAMGDKFNAIVDVTIVYPDGAPTFWHFMCGRMKRVVVRVRQLPVPHDMAKGDYANDPAVRQAYSDWIKDLWTHKDQQIAELLQQAGKPQR